ncbi:MAG: hypothetical protein PHY47_03135 [Lachnospiraceae bacterium]|nr:hypothetical protein [Lachnospiraceae bacterium]
MLKKRENMGKISYAIVLGLIVLASSFFVFLAGKGAELITEKANDYYMPYYQSGEKGFSSPWYRNGLHIVDEGFINELTILKEHENNIITIGSSLSVISLRTDCINLDKDYQYVMLACGNGSWRSDRVLDSLAQSSKGYSKDDIVKFEVSFSTFRDMEKSITESTLDKWGEYSVNDNLQVKKNTVLITPVYNLNLELLKIQNAWELGQSYLDQISVKEPKGIGNFKNNYFNYETVANSCNMDQEMIQSVENQILGLSKDANLVVELSYIPEGLTKTEFGKEFMEYIDEQLIPYLDVNQIPYFDYRDDFTEEEYADGVHLSYEASKKYTEQLNEDLNALINR